MCYDSPKKVLYLNLPNAKEPFRNWINKFSERNRLLIRAYIDRVARGGGKKNIKNIGDGVFEIKIKLGPGYRVYFTKIGNDIILLLLGGDKGTQKRDILLAKKYWRNYVSN